MILGRIRFLFNPLLMVGKKVVFLLRGFELQDVFLYIQTKNRDALICFFNASPYSFLLFRITITVHSKAL